ncbi:hypothetical protein CPB86DRAFT_407165 [Serendipita vermifera]|nr:hypothetical protein CPB86DRAFT_407165 [Serendipita vermifera]
MMKELTSLHSSMSAAGGTAKRPSKRAQKVAPDASQAYPHSVQPRSDSAQGFAGQPPDSYGQQMPYQNMGHGQPVQYMPPDGHYGHSYDPHNSYSNFPLSEAFPSGYHQQGQSAQAHPPPPQLHVQPPNYPTHPVYDYNQRSGSDGESPLDNNPPPNSAHDSIPSQSPATPTSANVPPSATSLHAPQGAYPSHHHYPHHHHEPNGGPYSRSPVPTPPPQSFRQPLRGVRDGAAGGEYYQPLPLSQQHGHSYQHYPNQQHDQSRGGPHASPYAQAGGRLSHDDIPSLVQVKREEYSLIPPLIKAEQPDGHSARSRASSADSLSEQRDTGQYLSDHNKIERDGSFGNAGRGNDSAAGVTAGSFGGEQRFPGEFNHLQLQSEQQQQRQHFRGGYLPLAQHDRNEYGPARHQERTPPHDIVPVSPLDTESAHDRPGTAPASFAHNGQLSAFASASASSSSPAAAQSSHLFTDAMATAAASNAPHATSASAVPDKYYSSIGGFREQQHGHDAAGGGSNSPPFRFGAPSPRQQGRPELEQHQQPGLSSFRGTSSGGSFVSSTATSRPGNVLRPLPGWSSTASESAPTSASAIALGFNSSNDSPFSFNAPQIGYPGPSDYKTNNARKRPHSGSDDDESRPFSSRPATRSGRDAVDESTQPRPTSRRLSVMELCNTRSGGGGHGLPDGFDSNRPRTSSGRFASTQSGPNGTSGASSSFSFPASPSNPSFGNYNSGGLRPSSSGAGSFQFGSQSVHPLSGNAPSSTVPGGGSSRPSSSAGRGLEQYALNLNGGSSRPGTSSGQWSNRGNGGDDDHGRTTNTGIILPPLHLSSSSSSATTPARPSSYAGTSGNDAYGKSGRRRDGLAGGLAADQGGISSTHQPTHGLRA